MTTNRLSGKDNGLVFPADKNGKRSTLMGGKTIVAAALRPVDAALADAIMAEKRWRKQYQHYFVQMTAASLESAENALTIAQSGLATAHTHFEFVRDNVTLPLQAAMQKFTRPYYRTAIVHGNSSKRPFAVPYKGKKISGDALSAQLNDWLKRGIIEPSHHAAIERVTSHPEWFDNDDHAFVLMGAGAEIGPYRTLLHLGATVVAVDLNRPAIWEKLIAAARDSAGTLIFPTHIETTPDMTDKELAAFAGANLITHAPEVATWLKELDRPLTLGGYAYLDSGDFVRVSMAMDAVIASVSKDDPRMSLAFLLTPTDVMGVPQAVTDESQTRHSRSTGGKLVHALSGSRWFAPNIRQQIASREGRKYGVVNSLVTQQGPNYTLAKRIQRWRSIVAREQGHIVSCNVAPATYTYSVTKNKLFMAGYAGAEKFGVEIFRPSTTNVIMTALLLHDLHYVGSAANPAVELDNPEELFMEGANHGGMWRMPAQLSSLLEVSVVVGYVRGLFKRTGDDDDEESAD